MGRYGSLYLDATMSPDKGKGVSVFTWLSTMPWRHKGEWRYMSTILDLGTRWRWVSDLDALPLGNEPPVPTGQEARWAPELVWMLWRRKKSWSCRETNSGRPARSTELWTMNNSCQGNRYVGRYSGWALLEYTSRSLPLYQPPRSFNLGVLMLVRKTICRIPFHTLRQEQ
jgi:hypothetical protein